MRMRTDRENAPEGLPKERVAEIERYLLDSLVEDLERYKPDLIFVNRGEFEGRAPR